jgi:ACS family pantothenate transporter-like MFS transporter
MVNNLGTVSSAVAVVSAIAISYYTDLSGSRWEAAVTVGVVCLFSNIVLTVWNVPYGLHFFAYIALGAAHGIGPLLVTWTGEALADGLETRSIVFAVQNTLGEVAGLVVPLGRYRMPLPSNVDLSGYVQYTHFTAISFATLHNAEADTRLD